MEPKNDPTKETIQAYDEHAAATAEYHWQANVSRAQQTFGDMIPPGGKILDVGCGSGRDLAAFQQRGFEIVGADLSLGMLIEAKRRLPNSKVVQANMLQLPFQNSQFDGAWMMASLLHLPRSIAPNALIEVRRILGLGSLLNISTKLGDGEAWHTGKRGKRFFTYYQPDELSELIQQANFEILHTWIEPSEFDNWINIIAGKI